MLKLVGSEGFVADVKINHMIKVPTGTPVVIITNNPNLYLGTDAMKARLMNIEFTESIDWLGISSEEFTTII